MRKDLKMRSPKLFKRTYTEGKSAATKDLVLYSLNLTSDEQTKVGLSVGRKVGNAVTRNKVKRRLRAVVRDYADALEPGFFLVFVVRPRAALSSFADLRASVDRLLQAADALKDR